MYKVLARKYRPSVLDEVIGQEITVQILKNAIKTGKLHHAVLLSGPMGTGKTSLARIISKSLNCQNGPTVNPCNNCEACRAISAGKDVDVMEIDGASNRKIENARAIIESVKYPPLKRKFKIYIIDEVHMFTMEAFNAMLKTIEEPPNYVKFIFATTAIEKVPDTILSRCQILSLKRIPQDKIAQKLKFISKKEGINIENDAIQLIAYASNGSLRVAEGFLDRCISFKPNDMITQEDASLVLGISTTETAHSFIENILKNKLKDAIDIINQLDNESKNLEIFARQVLDNLSNLQLSLEKKTALLNIFYQTLINIKQKIDPLSSLIVATYKAESALKLDTIENLIEKLSNFNPTEITPHTNSEETQIEGKHTLNTSNETDTEKKLSGNINDESKVDLILKTFGGKIINVENVEK